MADAPEWPKSAEEIWAAIEIAGDPDLLPKIEPDDKFVPVATAVDELVQIRKVANESMPPRNLDMQNVRASLEAIDGYAEKAIDLLGGR